MDLSAAFDTIDHDRLLNKLKDIYGLKVYINRWFKSYLNNRTYVVKIGDSTSSAGELIYGMPQDSMLEAILFTLYIQNFEAVALQFNLKINIYADDRNLYSGFNPTNKLTASINSIKECMDRVKIWMTKNCMKLNIKKT